MKNLFEKIKQVALNAVYLNNGSECIPCPPDTDTASMKFVEVGGYTVGFTSLGEKEKADVENLLKFGAVEPSGDVLRCAAYDAHGVTDHEMIVALWEFVVEGKKEAVDKLQAIRLAVKESIPTVDESKG